MFSTNLFLLYLAIVIALAFFPTATAFKPYGLVRTTPLRFSSVSLSAKKKTTAEDEQYWQGDWVCADCGYVYDRDIDGGGLYFEQQKKGFICPQCSAPRKRYAKKGKNIFNIIITID